jgi:hypothetical protein
MRAAPPRIADRAPDGGACVASGTDLFAAQPGAVDADPFPRARGGDRIAASQRRAKRSPTEAGAVELSGGHDL